MIFNKDIDNGKPFDWGKSSDDYAMFRDIYPDEFYQKIIDLGLCVKGQRVLDLGTGTGVLPRNLYKYGASFVGADIAEKQIEQARRLSSKVGLDIEYIVAAAEDIDFPAKCFDVVTACCCFHYFNREVALPKIHALLKDSGHFAIMFMAWLPDESDIAKRSEELVLKYNPEWTGFGMQRHTPCGVPQGAEAFFEVENEEILFIKIPFTRESWHGRIKACRGIGASSLPAEEIAVFEKEHLESLNSRPERFEILHSAMILNMRKI